MKRFDVTLILPNGQRREVGVLVVEAPMLNGSYRAAFQYSAAWLADPERFPLDPVSLPLQSGTFGGSRLGPPLGVFDDALPDRWGRTLLLNALPRSARTDANLIALRARNGLGALEFIEHGAIAPPPAPAPVDRLDELLMAAGAFERGEAVADTAMRRLLAAGATAGGARPKATVSDAEGRWIAKFPSTVLDGRFDIVGLEHAAMACARAAGLSVPDTRLIRVGRRKVLLVRRFDVTAVGRRHMLSFSTLCRERDDYRVSRYDDLAEVLRKHSCVPRADVGRLFRHAIFNGLLGNTDDHLKNFALIRGDDGFTLAPAYDLLPDHARNGESVLFFGRTRTIESIDTVLDMAARWGVDDAEAILDHVVQALTEFRAFAADAGAPAVNIEEIALDIDRRLAIVIEPPEPSPTPT